jgi:hypothetical protein
MPKHRARQFPANSENSRGGFGLIEKYYIIQSIMRKPQRNSAARPGNKIAPISELAAELPRPIKFVSRRDPNDALTLSHKYPIVNTATSGVVHRFGFLLLPLPGHPRACPKCLSEGGSTYFVIRKRPLNIVTSTCIRDNLVPI